MQSHRKNLITGMSMGAVVTVAVAILMGQGANQPVKSETQYFVTADGDHAHLWAREGATLRVVGHGECKDCPMEKEHGDHESHDGHGKEAPKK